MLEIIKKVSDIVEKVTAALGIVTFITMTVSACVQVTMRYCFSYSPLWTEELCRYSFIWTNALGATICYKHGAHAAVDFHIKFLPAKISAIFFLFGHVCVFICGLLMMTQGFKVAMVTAAQPSAALKLPMMYVYMSIVVAGFIFCIHSVYLFLKMFDKTYLHSGLVTKADEGGAA